MNSENKEGYTLKIRLSPHEQERLNFLSNLTNKSKAAVLKQSLYSDTSGSAAFIMQLVETAFFKMDAALTKKDCRAAREEMMNLCRTLNCVNSTEKTQKK